MTTTYPNPIFSNVTCIDVTANTFINTTSIIVGNGVGGYAFASLGEFHGTTNSYVQFVVQNSNAGNNASTDLCIEANSGNDTVNYLNLGIDSSTYANGSWTITGALDGYLFSSNTNLVIGVQAAKQVIFFANGTVATNQIMAINATSVTINTGITLLAGGTVNAPSYTVGTNFTVNTTVINIATLSLYANNSLGTNGQALLSNGTATYWGEAIPTTKGFGVLLPVVNDVYPFMWTNVALTILEIRTIVSGSTPSVTASFYWGADGSGASGVNTIATSVITTNVTSGNSLTSFTNGTPSANTFLWCNVTAVSGTVNTFGVTIRFK